MGKRLYFFILLWATVLSAQFFKFGAGAAIDFSHQDLANSWSTGFAIPLFFKYEVNPSISTYIGLQYGWNGFSSSSILDWTDPLSGLPQQKQINVTDNLHSYILSGGFEYYFPVNWQETKSSVLKYLYPYFGLDIDFFFIDQIRSYVSDLTGVPDYLAQTYKQGSVLLTPTIGAGIRLGTKIRLVKRTFLDVSFRYLANIPEEKMKDLYPNHFISFGIGCEFMVAYEPLMKKTTPPKK